MVFPPAGFRPEGRRARQASLRGLRASCAERSSFVGSEFHRVTPARRTAAASVPRQQHTPIPPSRSGAEPSQQTVPPRAHFFGRRLVRSGDGVGSRAGGVRTRGYGYAAHRPFKCCGWRKYGGQGGRQRACGARWSRRGQSRRSTQVSSCLLWARCNRRDPGTAAKARAVAWSVSAWNFRVHTKLRHWPSSSQRPTVASSLSG